MANTNSDYLRYKADNYNCICKSRHIRKGIISPECDHCRLLCIAAEIEILHRNYNELQISHDDTINALRELAIEKNQHESDAMKYFECLQALLEDMKQNRYSKYAKIISEVIS